MNLLEKMIQEKLEQTKAEAERMEKLREAKALHVAELLQPLYDEFREATKDIYIPAHTYQFQHYVAKPIFDPFRDYGHGYRLSEIKIADLRVRVSQTNDHLFYVSVSIPGHKGFDNKTANEVREIVCDYVAENISKGKFQKMVEVK